MGHETHLITTDLAGNVENTQSASFKIDMTPPVTTALLSGASKVNGWYTGPLAVTLSATDNLSGVAGTKYQLDGGTMHDYGAPFVIAGDGQFWAQ